MTRRLKFVVVLLMLAMVPVRALATVTTGFCAMHLASDALEGVHGGHHHGDDDAAPHGDDHQHNGCNSCVEHCASGAIVALAPLLIPAVYGAVRISSGDTFVAGFIPEQVDPPPLAG